MKKYLQIFEKLIEKFACPCFIVITFIHMLLRVPFYDEAYGFMVSQLNIGEIFRLIPVEGHPFGWYMLLKIFCSNLNLYPYPMLIMNWLFFSVFIYLFWKKAPFNNVIKFLITFSFCFLNYYAIYARPYGLSILLLFLLTILYKDSTKKPFLYCFLILCCFNLCVLCMFGAGAFFILFLNKIIKEKMSNRKKILIFLILFIGTIISALQFLHLETIYDVQIDNYFKYLTDIFIPTLQDDPARIAFCIIRLVFIFYLPCLLFKKSKESLFFLVFTYIFLIILTTKIYPLAPFWHAYFYLVYLIISLCMCWDLIKKDKLFNIILIMLLLCLLTPYSILEKRYKKSIDTSNYKSYINAVLYLNKKESKFFCLDWYSPVSSGIIPYLKQNNIVLYDSHNHQKDTYESMKNTYKYIEETFNGEEFINYLDDNKDNYLLSAKAFFIQGNNENILKFNDKGFKYKDLLSFEVAYYNPKCNYYIFKINKLKNSN